MFHNDAGRTGATDEEVVPPLHLAWFKTLGGTIHISSPVVADETVYIGVADEENKGQAGIYALDGVTGAIKWRYATASSIRHTVAVDAQRCYGITIDGMVIALDKATGRRIWQYSLGNEMERWCSRWVMATPLVYDNTVYAGVAPYFVALEATTGKEIWRAPRMGGDWISWLTSPAGDKERIYVSFNWGDKGSFALNRKNGIPVWNNTNKYGTGHASPVCSGGSLYYGGNLLCALEPQSGACIWSNKQATIATAAIARNTLVIGCRDNKIQAIDSVTGKEIWTYHFKDRAKLFFWPYERTASPIISSPAIAGQIVYCGGTDGQFVALDLRSGKLLWSYDLGSPITSSPAVSGNTVYIAAFDGTVYAFTALCR
jgi:outer membrane protein assembly factor BamB